MKRLSFACALGLLSACAIGGIVSAASPRARLRSFECKRALDPADRAISVTAVMRPLPKTRRMALKFDLLSKTKRSGHATTVTGGDLGTWLHPADPKLGQRPGDIWIFKHPVRELAAPATYHFRVTFRWSGAHGHVIGEDVRLGPSCYQPERRPDLLVQSIQVQSVPGQANNQRYTAVIRNSGATAARHFQVWFTYGAVVQKRSVTKLAAHSMITETFVGPLCTTNTAPTVAVDPMHRVDDYNPANNSQVANCSSTSGT